MWHVKQRVFHICWRDIDYSIDLAYLIQTISSSVWTSIHWPISMCVCESISHKVCHSNTSQFSLFLLLHSYYFSSDVDLTIEVQTITRPFIFILDTNISRKLTIQTTHIHFTKKVSTLVYTNSHILNTVNRFVYV